MRPSFIVGLKNLGISINFQKMVMRSHSRASATTPQRKVCSGSHERYKTLERLKFEEEFDCIRKLRKWIIENGVATDPELVAVEQEDYAAVEGIRKLAWEDYLAPILDERGQVMDMLDEIAGSS